MQGAGACRGIVAYKNTEAGVSAHGANMVFEKALIADSRIGIDFSQSPNANQTFRSCPHTPHPTTSLRQDAPVDLKRPLWVVNLSLSLDK
jgi:hypothetical protein